MGCWGGGGGGVEWSFSSFQRVRGRGEEGNDGARDNGADYRVSRCY